MYELRKYSYHCKCYSFIKFLLFCIKLVSLFLHCLMLGSTAVFSTSTFSLLSLISFPLSYLASFCPVTEQSSSGGQPFQFTTPIDCIVGWFLWFHSPVSPFLASVNFIDEWSCQVPEPFLSSVPIGWCFAEDLQVSLHQSLT